MLDVDLVGIIDLQHIFRSNKDTQLSKLLSWLLRHGAVKEGFLLSSEGYLPVDQILQHKSFRGKYNRSDIERVVANNDKQRFKLRVNPHNNVLEIKANQGHSIPEIGVQELKPILDPIGITAVHGTYLKCWPSIKQRGLSRMRRQHIHLAKGTPGNTNVISGIRNNAQIYIYIDIKKALDDGLKFYESENGVILTPGNDKGYLEAKYFQKVVKVNSGPIPVMEPCVAAPPPACTSRPAPSPAKSRPRQPEKTEYTEPQDACKVIVTGYPPYTRAEDLVLVLTKFGTVTVERRGRREMVMEYSNEEEAKAALKGTKTLMVYGEYLTIKPYAPITPEKKVNKRDFPKSKEKDTIIEPKEIDLSGDFYQQVDHILASVRLTQEEVNTISSVYVDLENILQAIWPGCQALPFGSITTGLGIKTSDADCFILVPPQFRQPSVNFVHKTKRMLQMYPRLFTEIISIPRANTPIVKFFHIPSQTNCDVSFKTTLGVQNSKLIAFLLHADPRLIPVAVILKYWAKVHGLSGTGKITNYALTMMIIFYLQQLPMSILPSIEWLQRDPTNDFYVDFWNTGFMGRRDLLPPTCNTSSISELLGGFFEYYSNFNFDEFVVCPYLGKPVKKEAFNDFNELPESFQRYKNNIRNKIALPLRSDTSICVQDPVEQSHNVASAITCRMASDIKAYLKFAANAYDKEKLNNCEKFLRIILMQQPVLAKHRSNPKVRVMLFPKMLLKIEDHDWKTVVRDIVFVIYEKMLKIKLGKLEETINPVTKKEKEKYTGTVTKAVWRRRQFSKLYDTMGLNIQTKQEMITQEVMKVEKEQLDIKFQLTLTFSQNPRSLALDTRLNSGNADAYGCFGRFVTSVTMTWFEELLKPYIKVRDKNIMTEKIFINTKLMNDISLNDTGKKDELVQIVDSEDSSDDSS